MTGTKTQHGQKVITWQSGNGQTLDICPKCQADLEAAGEWPKDSRGSEYCSVSRGLHRGLCEID